MVALQGSWKSKPWLKQERVHLLLVQQMMTPIHSPQNRRTRSRFSHFLASQMPCKAISMLGSHPHFKETSQCSFEAKAKRNTTSKPTNKTTGKDWLIKHSSFSLTPNTFLWNLLNEDNTVEDTKTMSQSLRLVETDGAGCVWQREAGEQDTPCFQDSLKLNHTTVVWHLTMAVFLLSIGEKKSVHWKCAHKILDEDKNTYDISDNLPLDC